MNLTTKCFEYQLLYLCKIESSTDKALKICTLADNSRGQDCNGQLCNMKVTEIVLSEIGTSGWQNYEPLYPLLFFQIQTLSTVDIGIMTLTYIFDFSDTTMHSYNLNNATVSAIILVVLLTVLQFVVERWFICLKILLICFKSLSHKTIFNSYIHKLFASSWRMVCCLIILTLEFSGIAFTVHNYFVRRINNSHLPAIRHEFFKSSIRFKIPSFVNNMNIKYKIYSHYLIWFNIYVKKNVISTYM